MDSGTPTRLTKCGRRLYWRLGGRRYLVCVLSSGHDGQHSNGGWYRWGKS